MSKTSIPTPVKMMLWGKAAGRCQYDGCNELLNLDLITKTSMNASYIAHIYADQPLGPRYHPVHSPDLVQDISNLILLCDRHHRLVDREAKDSHPAERLLEMKRVHEDRIERLTSLRPEKQSHVILFGANIGSHGAPLTAMSAGQAMLPARYPANIIELGLKNCLFEDHTTEYWQFHHSHLEQIFNQHVRPLIGQHEVQHFSVFGLAPMPMLIKLGSLLSDISEADVYQRHREPSTWDWQEDASSNEFELRRPKAPKGVPVLKLSCSANITDDRIKAVLTDEHSIWEITHVAPGNDFLRSRVQLKNFRVLMRKTFDEIKAAHGPVLPLHIFPAMPVAAAVELGRVWMPKADLSLKIYDQQNKHLAFIPALHLN
jgi:hypothetical protein